MFYAHTYCGVTVYKSMLLDHVPHGFSTRLGGVSSGDALGTANMGFGKEPDEIVLENRRRFASAAGLPTLGREIFVSAAEQIHSDIIFCVTEADSSSELRGDGLYTDSVGVSVAVKTADCVPVLLATRGGEAVAAVHAGWRGTAMGIAALAVERLCSLGFSPSDIVAATGPAVQKAEYKVGDDFDALLFELMSKSRSKYVAQCARELSQRQIYEFADGKHCDLPALNRDILTAVGVKAENIDVCDISTFENGELFYSHRRQGTNRGVMLSAIAPAAKVHA